MLDRLVGYEISPVLWSKVRRGLSAGRVQSVAVRLVVDREAEIKAFRPEEYWTVATQVEGSAPPPFAARVVRLDGAKAALSHEGQASEVVSLLSQATLRVASVERKERRKNPPPPFITSRLRAHRRTLPLCEAPVRRSLDSGRSTFYCPRCQRR